MNVCRRRDISDHQKAFAWGATIVLLLLGYAVCTLFAVYTFLFFTFASIFDDIMISLGHYWSTYSAFYSAAFSSTPAINADSRRTEEWRIQARNRYWEKTYVCRYRSRWWSSLEERSQKKTVRSFVRIGVLLIDWPGHNYEHCGLAGPPIVAGRSVYLLVYEHTRRSLAVSTCHHVGPSAPCAGSGRTVGHAMHS